jgi:hypothetical protein
MTGLLTIRGNKLWIKTEGQTIKLEKAEDTWDDLQGILANTPMAKKHTVLEAIEIGKKREAK